MGRGDAHTSRGGSSPLAKPMKQPSPLEREVHRSNMTTVVTSPVVVVAVDSRLLRNALQLRCTIVNVHARRGVNDRYILVFIMERQLPIGLLGKPSDHAY